MASLAQKRRETEVFSLSFLDCICCGFGAVLLIFLLTIAKKTDVDKADVDAAYARLVERALVGGAYAAIATHDEPLIRRLLAFAERHGIPRERFELQMLYGVRQRLQLELLHEGYKVLVATPYGPEWYPYLMRRLAERPANLGFIARNLVRR